MPDPTGTLVDWLEEWHREEGWLCSKAEVARLVDEIGRLREQNTGLGVRIQESWKRIEQTEEALSVIARRAGESGCEHSTTWRSACRRPGSGRLRTSARGTAEEWCDACVAYDALGVPLHG